MLVEEVEGVKYEELVRWSSRTASMRAGQGARGRRGQGADPALRGRRPGVDVLQRQGPLPGQGDRDRRVGGHPRPGLRRPWAGPIDDGPADHPREAAGHQRHPDQSLRPRLPLRVHPDRDFVHRRAQHARARAEAPDLLRDRASRTPAIAAQIARQAKVRGIGRELRRRLRGHGHHLRGGQLLHPGLPARRAPSSGRCCS